MVAASCMKYDICLELVSTYNANVNVSSEIDGNTVLHVLGNTQGLQQDQENNFLNVFCK